MATKKISDLFKLSQLSEDDEFVVVDKSTTGSAPETGLGGRTTKVTFKDLKEAVGTSGPQGERGPQGNAGPQGPIGPVGPIGPRGPVGGGGTQGERGPVGPIGPKGDTGPAGPVGPRGDTGPRGPSGAAADRGPKGDKGDTGARGAVGPQGPQGVAGERGAIGPMGRQGDKGATGSTGPMGPKGKDGANGAPGARGQKGDTGATGPAGRAGIDAVRNFCSDKNWPIGRHLSYADEDTGGNFDPNGGSAENEVVWGDGPFGYNVKIWQARKNDRHSGGDGGWNKKITGLDKNKSYVSVTYVRRTNASTNGTFYHGPDLYHADNCLNLNGTLNRNPYFSSFNIGVLPLNAWCISIGYIHANNDPSQSNNALSGLYRLDTGQKLRSYTDYKMKNSVSGHRTYLFYSTDPNASIDWCLPGFYEVNSDCPVYRQLLGLAGISGTGGSGGEAGPQGPSGPQGPKGDRGPTGPQGPRGYTGPQGIQGPKGSNGSAGARGPIPSHGWSGTSLRFIQSNGSWGSYVNLKGATGPQGPKGDNGVFAGGNVSAPITINTTSNDPIVIKGAHNPHITFYQKTTRKAYIGWSGAELQMVNSSGSGDHVGLLVKTGVNGLKYKWKFGKEETVYHSGNLPTTQTTNITYSSGLKAISNSGYTSNVRNYGGPTGSWPGLFDGYQLSFQIRTTTGRPGIGKGVQSADWGVDGNGFARVRGNGAGVGLLDGRSSVTDFYDQEIARFQDNGIICRRHVLIQNKQNDERRLSLRPARIRIAGHGGTAANFEGGQLELCHPYNIDKTQEGFVYIDNYYDYNGIYRKNIKQAYLRLGHKGSQAFMVAANHQHQIDGHITLYDGNNAGVIFHGKPGGHGSNAYNDLLFRHYPTYNTYQDQAAIRKNGDFECRGTFRANRNWRSASDIRRKKDITPMNSNESLGKVLELNPVRFNWKLNPEKHLQMGLIAQEVEKILPSIIDESVDMDTAYDINSPEADPTVEDKSPKDLEVKTKCISYNELIPLLISAMQEQQKQIDDLKKQIASK